MAAKANEDTQNKWKKNNIFTQSSQNVEQAEKNAVCYYIYKKKLNF